MARGGEDIRLSVSYRGKERLGVIYVNPQSFSGRGAAPQREDGPRQRVPEGEDDEGAAVGAGGDRCGAGAGGVRAARGGGARGARQGLPAPPRRPQGRPLPGLHQQSLRGRGSHHRAPLSTEGRSTQAGVGERDKIHFSFFSLHFMYMHIYHNHCYT